MNQLIYLLLFIIITLIYIQHKPLYFDTFTDINLCSPYQKDGIHCPHRIHYRKGRIIGKTNRQLKENNTETNNTNTTTNTNTNTDTNNSIINNACIRGGNGDVVKKELKEGKDYIKLFGKYPVVLDNNGRKLNRYPWWSKN